MAASPSAPKTPDAPVASPSGVLEAVSATGTEGRRTWRFTSEGAGHVYVLADAAPAVVEKGPRDDWFLVGANGRASALTVPPGTSLASDTGRQVLRAPVGPVIAQESSPLLTASWVDRQGEKSLRVKPAEVAREWASSAAQDAMWAELVHAAPAAATPGMRDQLVCHMMFAPTKTAWFLEPDRPAVGFAATVAARCNPGNVADGG